jgi:hypothetical protein
MGAEGEGRTASADLLSCDHADARQARAPATSRGDELDGGGGESDSEEHEVRALRGQ